MSLHSSPSDYYNDHSKHGGDANSLNSEKLGKSPKMNHFIIPAFLLEVAILILLAVFAYYLRFTSTFTVFNRAFPCKDNTSISYPASDDSYVTIYVNDNTFYCISSLVPVAVILFGELFYQFCGPQPGRAITTISKSFKIPLFVRRLFRFVGVFWTGLLVTSILTDSIKLLSGRHRPNFLSSIDLTQITYLDPDSSGMCTTWAVVTDPTSSSVRFYLLSFPSYYATMSGYAAAFAICYVYVIGNIHGNYFVRPLVSAAFAGMALLAGFTRWMLYLNFWDDILIGYIIGLSFAVYLSFGILNAFEEHEDDDFIDSPRRIIRLQEARPGFFRFLPRLTMRPRRRPYPPLFNSNGNAEPNTFRPDPVFQQDLHHTIENFDSPQSEQLE